MAGKSAYWGIVILICAAQAGIALNTASQAKNAVQVPNQSIKVKTELVEVRAVVTDRQGRPIENLHKEDFALLVNNQPRTIDVFSVVSTEDKGSPTVEKSPAMVAKNLGSRLTETPARTVVLFIDTLHLSASSLMQTKQVLRRFVNERLTARDMVALVTSSGTLGLAQQFTRDRQLLTYGIEKIGPGLMARESFFTPYLAASIESGDADAMALGIDLLRSEDGIDGDLRSMEILARRRAAEILIDASYVCRATFLTLKAIADQMTSMPGQRMIVLFSDGFSMRERGGGLQTSELESTIGRAVRSGVTIYSIDTQGLRPPPIFDVSMRGGAAGPRLVSYLSSAEMDEQNGMHALAADTGGEMYHDTNDPEGALGKALDANRSYYVLGYYLGNNGDSRRFLQYTLRVKNHPEYLIRTQKGYFAPDKAEAKQAEDGKNPERRFAQAIQNPLPVTALGVSACAEYIESDDDKQLSLTIWLDGQNLQYREVEQRYVSEVDVISLIYDAKGKQIYGFSELIQGNLTLEQVELAKRNGYRFFQRLALKPGVYQARIGVREKGTDRIGTANAWIEVPDPARSRYVVSNLVPVDAASAANSSGEVRMQMSVGKSRVVQGVRMYPGDRPCPYYFQVQRGAKAEAELNLEFQMEIAQAGKTLVRSNWQPVSMGIKDDKWFTVTGQLSLASLNPGIYELRAIVREPQSKRTVIRSVIFGVESAGMVGVRSGRFHIVPFA
jgi:VWFA-related protein